MSTNENFLSNLPDDKEALKAMLHSLWLEREHQEKRAEEYLIVGKPKSSASVLTNCIWRSYDCRWSWNATRRRPTGPRADRLSMNQLAQMLLEFAQTLEQKPINLEDLRQAEPEPELRRVKRRKRRRALANFENLPVQTHVYELSAEERPCPSCGVER